jgi:hypothetical protein
MALADVKGERLKKQRMVVTRRRHGTPLQAPAPSPFNTAISFHEFERCLKTLLDQ